MRAWVTWVLCGLVGLAACDGGNARTLVFQISAEAQRVGIEAQVDVTVSVETSAGVAAEADFELALAVGTDVLLSAVPVAVGEGQYTAGFTTEIAGPATVLVFVGEERVESFDLMVPAGTLTGLELSPGGRQLPGRPIQVGVVAIDDSGNPVVSPDLNLEVRSTLPFTRTDTACGEPILSFASDAIGIFAIEVEDLTTGLIATTDVSFGPYVLGPPSLDPFSLAAGETAMVEFPVEVHVPDAWDTTRLDIGVEMDPGFSMIATFQGAEPEGDSCATVDGTVSVPLGGGAFRVAIGLVRPFPFTNEGGGCIRSPYPRVKLLYLVSSPAITFPVEGALIVTDVAGDVNHPATGTPNAPATFAPGRAMLCTSKTVHQGCIDYVRVTPTQTDANGNLISPPTTEAIQQAHDDMNRTLGSACIEFTANIIDVTLDIDGLKRKVTERRVPPGINAVNQLLGQQRSGNCLLVVLHDNVDPKGITYAPDPPDTPSPLFGTFLTSSILGNGRSLAHEIGHQLLRPQPANQDHEREKNNLMTPSDRNGRPSGATGRFLENEQVMAMQDSPWLSAATKNYYIVVGGF